MYRRKVRIGAEAKVMVDDALSALECCPEIYHRGGELVHIVHHRRSLAIQPLPAPRLRELLSDLIYWYDIKDEEMLHRLPPQFVVDMVRAREQWPDLRPLTCTVETPILKPDGTVLADNGYDAQLQAYVELRFKPVRVALHPTASDVATALAQLREPVSDFPFAAPHYESAWLATTLTPLARLAFEGPAPIAVVDAPAAGTGKTLLAKVAGLIATGRIPAVLIHTANEEEMRKRIFSLALAGDRFVLIDNIRGSFGSPALDATLTGTEMTDRILGASRTRTVPLLAMWVATGNNLVIVGDTTRRVLPLRVVATTDRPEERCGFRHADLLSWVRAQRSELVCSALTLLRAYCDAGRPDQHLSAWGSFEEWSELVRATVVWAGQPDPADGRLHIVSSADDERALLIRLLTWIEQHQPANSGLTSAALATAAQTDAALSSTLAELTHALPGTPLDPRGVGNKLKRFADRVVGKLMLQRLDQKTSEGVEWRARRVQANDAGDAGDADRATGRDTGERGHGHGS